MMDFFAISGPATGRVNNSYEIAKAGTAESPSQPPVDLKKYTKDAVTLTSVKPQKETIGFWEKAAAVVEGTLVGLGVAFGVIGSIFSIPVLVPIGIAAILVGGFLFLTGCAPGGIAEENLKEGVFLGQKEIEVNLEDLDPTDDDNYKTLTLQNINLNTFKINDLNKQKLYLEIGFDSTKIIRSETEKEYFPCINGLFSPNVEEPSKTTLKATIIGIVISDTKALAENIVEEEEKNLVNYCENLEESENKPDNTEGSTPARIPLSNDFYVDTVLAPHIETLTLRIETKNAYYDPEDQFPHALINLLIFKVKAEE